MALSDKILARIRSDLNIRSEGADLEFLWEHAGRVARVARDIARLPEVVGHDPDLSAVQAACLYHNAGWVALLRAGDSSLHDVFMTPVDETGRRRAIAMVERSLHGLLPHPSLTLAVRSLRALPDRNSDLVEAQIVRDAVNLEEFGLLSLWPVICRSLADGKGVGSMIGGWRRKQEYGFWSARLQDSFHFSATRDMAKQRLARLERFMAALEEEHLGLDLGMTSTVQPRESYDSPLPA